MAALRCDSDGALKRAQDELAQARAKARALLQQREAQIAALTARIKVGTIISIVGLSIYLLLSFVRPCPARCEALRGSCNGIKY